ncbi:thioredoxin family protein [Planctomicrobium sp. SH664]|uniref:thioredoxin family protein n=1 Tax=Planctomicrobium sp. SH664 TaxID=3448125 RepID=UPI003F5BA837
MKILNLIVGIAVVACFAYALQQSVTPPDDPWFQAAVVERETPVLVKFGADWCPPCRSMDAILDQAGDELNGRVRVLRINVDEKPELAQHYGVSAIPRLILFQHGQPVANAGGFSSPQELVDWVKQKTP